MIHFLRLVVLQGADDEGNWKRRKTGGEASEQKMDVDEGAEAEEGKEEEEGLKVMMIDGFADIGVQTGGSIGALAPAKERKVVPLNRGVSALKS